MEQLDVIARCKVRPGQLEGFRSQVGEILRVTREHDRHTRRCDWFLNEDETQCEVHEVFPNEQALIEHKMNTMEATQALFRDFASDHHVTIYGTVSQDFVNLVTQRMGPPTVLTFFQGLESPAPVEAGSGHLEVIAHLKVRTGELAGFKAQVAEILRLARENDRHTLRYDWFINADETECEVHEAYVSEEGLIEHNQHVVAVRDALFTEHAFDHRMSVYGDISQRLTDLFNKHAGGVGKYSFLAGLHQAATV